MYTQIRDSLAVVTRRRGDRASRLDRNVICLGLTSLFTDISSEMVSAVLPIYLLFGLQAAAVQLGVVDGLYQGVTALVQVGSAGVAERGRLKPVAVAGYALSGVARLGMLAAGGAVGPLVGVILVDRAGKGIRTAPRDALISLSARPEQHGFAFGVHRALDTVGALLGPIVAFALLVLLPGRFDVIWVVSACFATIGVATIALLVRNRAAQPATRSPAGPTWRDGLALLELRRFRPLVLAATALGLATISDAFVYLSMQRQLGFDPSFLPLLAVATSLAFLVLAVPVGRLADRWGRGRVLLLGYGLLLLVDVALLAPRTTPVVAGAALLAFGAYYACTDGVMSALASGVLPEAGRALGLAVLLSAVALSRLAGSIAFGGLWTAGGDQLAVQVFLGGLLLALPGAALALRRAAR